MARPKTLYILEVNKEVIAEFNNFRQAFKHAKEYLQPNDCGKITCTNPSKPCDFEIKRIPRKEDKK